jgi:hypothetical protein
MPRRPPVPSNRTAVPAPAPRGQASTEYLVVAGVAVAILLGVGVTFRSELSTGVQTLVARVQCGAAGGENCGQAAAQTAANTSTGPGGTSTPAGNAYGLVGDLVGRSPAPTAVGGLVNAWTPPSAVASPLSADTPTLTPYRDSSIDTAMRGVDQYLHRFDQTTFGKAISLGDPMLFDAASRKNLTQVIDGATGKALCDARPKGGANGYHSSSLGSAEIAFPFETATPDTKTSWKNRQTMTHEMTHHIEWLNGSKRWYTWTGSERNTLYQDRVTDLLGNWSVAEARLTDPNSQDTAADMLFRWQQFEDGLRALEQGSSETGGYPPDANLDQLTGFRVRFTEIRGYYLSDACACPKLKELAELGMKARATEPGKAP